MMGTTSVIMFPIYAAGAILPDIVKWCDRWLSGLPDFLKADREEISPVALKLRHGLIYMVLIYTGEYIAGSFSDGQRTLSLGLFPVAGSDPRSHFVLHLSPSGLGPACFLSHSVPIDDLYLGRSFYIIVTV